MMGMFADEIEYLEHDNRNCDTDCRYCEYNNDCRSYKSRKMAIRSLEAWNKVINMLKNWADAKVSPKQRDAYFDCIELIKQTMKQEVSDVD